MANVSNDKLKALDSAMRQIEKDFGKGSIMKLGEERIDNIEIIPSGSIAVGSPCRPIKQI